MTGPLMAILGCPSGFSGFQSNRISISKTRLISIVLQPIQVIFVVVADVVCVVKGEISTLGSILDSQLSWESDKL